MPNIKLMEKMQVGQFAICIKGSNGRYKNALIGNKTECEHRMNEVHARSAIPIKVRVSYKPREGMLEEMTWDLDSLKPQD